MTTVQLEVSQADMIDAGKAAALLGVDRASVCRWAKSGYLPSVMKTPGARGMWVFDRRVVAALADARRRAEAVLDWSGPRWVDYAKIERRAS